MKVILWTQRLFNRSFARTGGIQTHISTILDTMQNHQFEVVSNLFPNTKKRENYNDHAVIVRFAPKDYFRLSKKSISWKASSSYSASADILRTKSQKKYIAKSDFDIVHIHDVDASLMRLAGSLNMKSLSKISDIIYELSEIKKPLLMTKHSKYPSHLPEPYHTMEKQLLGQMDGIICISRKEENYVKALYPEKNVWYIPNFVDTNRFNLLDEVEKNNKKNSLNLGGKDIGIIVSRLTEGKGLEMLLDVWAIISKERKNAHLIMVGGGKLHELLVRKSKELGLENHVTFTGQIKNPENYLQAADFYIQASESEGLSISLLEAMSCGLPVVATDVGGTRDVVKDGENGWLIEPSDKDMLKSCIIKILDEDKRMKMSESARETIFKEYNLKSNVEKIENIYKSLIQ